MKGCVSYERVPLQGYIYIYMALIVIVINHLILIHFTQYNVISSYMDYHILSYLNWIFL